ncbi:hypothetical protein [Sodalis sp. RH19]|uniref:hypothetical protein n=1 Tax=Sodalis sp. RH19 TaxID=3394334 RepID=UPI0039B6D8B6
MSTSDHVINILVQEGGYRELSRPFKVGSQSFDFTHGLVAGKRANDLVIVIELKGDTADDVIVRKVLALTRALDVMRSKRPVTAILTSGQPRSETVQSISKVCRVLPVGAPTGPDVIAALRDWLAVLLPLTQPPSVDTMLDWEADLRRAIPMTAKGTLMEALIAAAPLGKDVVESVLAENIGGSVSAVLDNEGDPH